MNGKQINENLEQLKQVDRERYEEALQELRAYQEANLEHVLTQMMIYDKAANKYILFDNLLLISILVITAFTPFVNYFDLPKFVPLLFGAIDIVLIGLTKIFNFKEHALNLKQVNQKLLKEYNQYRTSRGDYSNISIGEGLDLFLDRTEMLKAEAFQNYLTLTKSTTAMQTMQHIKTE